MMMSRIGSMLILLMVLGIIQASAAVLSVTDGLSSPGKPVTLQARLTNPDADGEKGLANQIVEFIVHGRLVGQAKTDEKGWARLDFVPSMRGNLPVIAKVVTESVTEAIEAKGVLLSWERRRPILLIDVAVLVTGELENAPPPERYEDPGLKLGEAQSAAPAELDKLSQFYYNLIYLDLTGRGSIETIQDWLRDHHFPPGMVRILSPDSTFLNDLLHDLKEEGWEKVSGGIGRTADFAEVLVRNRLQTVIVPLPNVEERYPRRAIVLHDWSRIRRHL